MKLNSLHIVIAEDDYDDSEIIYESFSKHPSFTKVDLVKNGRELINYLNDRGEKLPDIILTDINMPIMNGIEALKEIHDNAQYRNTPSFVYSTAINPLYEAKCTELGTKGFLIKPFSLAEFDSIPDRILEILLSKR